VVNARDEAEMVRDVLTVLPNVLLGNRDIKRKKPFELCGPAKDVGCVSRLGRLHDHRPLRFEDVLRAEEVQSVSRPGKMGVELGLIVGRPGDLRHVEGGGDPAPIAQVPQFCPPFAGQFSCSLSYRFLFRFVSGPLAYIFAAAFLVIAREAA